MSYANPAEYRASRARFPAAVSPAAVMHAMGETALRAAHRAAGTLASGVTARKRALRRRRGLSAWPGVSNRTLRDIGIERGQVFYLAGRAARQSDRDQRSGMPE